MPARPARGVALILVSGILAILGVSLVVLVQLERKASRQDWELNRVLPGPFRVRTVFRRQTPVPVDTPLLDSPVFDDLTLVYTPPGGAPLLEWGEGA